MQVKYLRASTFGFLNPEIRKIFLSQGMLPVVINDAYIPHLFRPERLQLWYGGSGCFVPGTLVRTETGLRAIESIRIGERVLSFDTDKRQPEYMPVLKTFRFSAVDIKQKFVTFVLPTYKIVCTANHEFYINGTWIAAGIIAERIMATNTEYRRALLHKQQGAATNNEALCAVVLQQVQGRDNETIQKFGWIPVNDDIHKPKKCIGKNSQAGCFSMDREPVGIACCEPQRFGQDEQFCRKSGMGDSKGEQRSFPAFGITATIQRGGEHFEQVKGMASIGNPGVCENKEEGASFDTFRKIRSERGDNKRCGASEQLEARTLKIEDIVDVFFSEPKGYVYDLCVEKNHNYCITSDNTIVHNSGKSDSKATELLLKCLLMPYCRVMYVRKVYDTIRMSQFQLFKDVIKRYGLEQYFKVREDGMTITCTQNSNMLFARGLDDVDKITSIAEVTDIWIEEPIDRKGSISSSDFTELNRRLRCPKAGNHIHFTFNPITRDGWIHDYFFKSNEYEAFTLKTTYLDNHFTPADQVRQFEILKSKKPEEYQVYALGEWGKLKQGLVFPEYMIVPEMPKDLRKSGYGMDWGFYPDPWTLVHCGTKDGVLYIDELFYETGHTSDTRTKAMLSIGLTKGIAIVADNNNEAIEEMRKKGWSNIVAAKKGPGSIKAGLNKMSGFKIAITERSKNAKKELDNYSWAIDKRTELPTGEPIGGMDHICDSVRYWCDKEHGNFTRVVG